jgi:flagellar hook-associated protein 1 FlgK
VYSYTFTLSGSEKNQTKVTNDRVGKVANVGTSIDYQGVPYYMSQMNEWVRTFSEVFNDILTSGYDTNGDQGIMMFTGDLTTTEGQYQMPDENRYDQVEDGKTLTVSVSDDSYYRLTASNFSISTALENDPDRLANRYKQGDGVEQTDLLQDLALVGTDKDKMKFRGASASEFLQCILSDIALNSQRANTFTQSFTDIASSIDTQRLSISGVDEDEEAISLVKYQNAYNLASKMIQTLTEIYDRLILETGV